MWSHTIQILITQIGVLALLWVMWTFHSKTTKKLLFNHPSAAGSILWSMVFLLGISTVGFISALVVSTTTVILSTLWLKYKKYVFTKQLDSVLKKQLKVIKI
jgi:hypothetical protein